MGGGGEAEVFTPAGSCPLQVRRRRRDRSVLRTGHQRTPACTRRGLQTAIRRSPRTSGCEAARKYSTASTSTHTPPIHAFPPSC